MNIRRIRPRDGPSQHSNTPSWYRDEPSLPSQSTPHGLASLPIWFAQAKDQAKSIGRYLRVGGEAESPGPVGVEAPVPPPIPAVVLEGDVLKSTVSTQEPSAALKVRLHRPEERRKDAVRQPRSVNTLTQYEAIAQHSDSSIPGPL